jgi:hypothetical protein
MNRTELAITLEVALEVIQKFGDRLLGSGGLEDDDIL